MLSRPFERGGLKFRTTQSNMDARRLKNPDPILNVQGVAIAGSAHLPCLPMQATLLLKMPSAWVLLTCVCRNEMQVEAQILCD